MMRDDRAAIEGELFMDTSAVSIAAIQPCMRSLDLLRGERALVWMGGGQFCENQRIVLDGPTIEFAFDRLSGTRDADIVQMELVWRALCREQFLNEPMSVRLSERTKRPHVATSRSLTTSALSASRSLRALGVAIDAARSPISLKPHVSAP
jgi:hypothetical protein